ncbi:MAG: hypothetical protein HY360_14365 [Verrucomicrobia bacterium]|nr:hypothetical protein [Verrucomicrobiota bacterium]
MNTNASAQTTAPIEPGAVGSPEFIRIGDARRLFGLGRTYCYGLLAEGKIRGVSLRKRGAKTGVRHLSVDSIRDFLRQEMESQS